MLNFFQKKLSTLIFNFFTLPSVTCFDFLSPRNFKHFKSFKVWFELWTYKTKKWLFLKVVSKKGKSWCLTLKIWLLAVLKFLDVVLKSELLSAGCLNFPKNSALVLIRLVLINGDCVYQCKSSRTYTDVDDGYNNHVEAFNSHAQSKWMFFHTV